MNLKRLVRKAYPTMNDQTALDHLVRKKFVEAITVNDLRNDVRLWRKETLDGTLAEVIRLEGVHKIKQNEIKMCQWLLRV